MTQYAILKDGVFVKYKNFDTPPEMATHKGYSALPVEYETVDTSTQQYTTQTVAEIIEPSRYLIRTTIADKTPAEITAIEEERRETVVTRMSSDLTFDKAIALTLFDVVNEVRALKSQAPLTLAQFKTYVKGKI